MTYDLSDQLNLARQRAARLHKIDAMLKQLYSDQNELQQQKRKLAEILAREEALDSLGRVRSKLDSAHNWGTFDLLGGGLLSGLAKHSHFSVIMQISTYFKLRKIDMIESLKSVE